MELVCIYKETPGPGLIYRDHQVAKKQDTRKISQLLGLLYTVNKSWNKLGPWKGPQKICSAVLLAKSRVQSNKNISSKNKKDRNAPVLVVRKDRADC